MPDRISHRVPSERQKKAAFFRQLASFAAAKVAVLFFFTLIVSAPPARAAADQAEPTVLSQTELTRMVEDAVTPLLRGIEDRVTFEIASPSVLENRPACTAAQVDVPPGQRLWGQIMVTLRCFAPDPWTVYVPVYVRRFGTYLVTTRPLRHRETVTARDVRPVEGELTTLPEDVVRATSEAVGKELRVSVAPGQPLRSSWLVAPLVVRNGQNVTVIQHGKGFRVETEGRAMNSAAQGEAVRVMLPNRQVIEGSATADGAVVVE